METTNQQARDFKGAVTAAWLMIGLTCLVALIPGIGFLTWFVGGPILLITFILGIVILSKGGTMQGIFILLMSLIVAPVFLLLAPILTTGLAAGSGGGAAGTLESESLEAIVDGAFPDGGNERHPDRDRAGE